MVNKSLARVGGAGGRDEVRRELRSGMRAGGSGFGPVERG